MKILVIEDNTDLLEVIKLSLEKEGFVVETALTFNSASEKIGVYEYDCILLDIMLPDGNGLKVLEQLKAEKREGGVIIISAKDSLDDKVLGLNLGADDYLTKPFHMVEMIARVNSLIRRNSNKGQFTINVKNIKVFPDQSTVYINEKQIEFSRKEYDILYYFITRVGHLVKKEVLAEGVWGDYIDQVDNYDFIYAQLKNLRKKLTEYGAEVEIKSIYGFGYKMVEL